MNKKTKKAKAAKKKPTAKKIKRPAAKKAVRKTAKKKVVKKRPVPAKKKKKIAKKITRPAAKKGGSRPIGVVTHFYNEISVAIIRFKEKVPLGTVLQFRGATTDFRHPVKSMQYEHKPISVAPKGKQIGIKVPKRVREGDKVHRA